MAKKKPIPEPKPIPPEREKVPPKSKPLPKDLQKLADRAKLKLASEVEIPVRNSGPVLTEDGSIKETTTIGPFSVAKSDAVNVVGSLFRQMIGDEPFAVGTQEGAKIVGISDETLKRKARNGEIPFEDKGQGSEKGRMFFRLSDLKNLAAAYAALKPNVMNLGGNQSSEPPEPQNEREAIERQNNPVIDEVRTERPELFAHFSDAEWRQLYSIRGHGGSLTREGVVYFAERITARKMLRRQFDQLLDTPYFETLQTIIGLMWSASSNSPGMTKLSQ